MKRDEIAQLLPAVFQRTLNLSEANPLNGLLEVMEALQAPSEAILSQLDAIFDPRRTTDDMVPFLAYWADLTGLFDESPKSGDEFAFSRSSIASGLGRLRELVATAAYLSQWRGTKKGLLLFLQTATGMRDFEIEEDVGLDGQPRLFHILVRSPKKSAQYSDLIKRIVELEKPAYVTYELSFEPAGGS
jgi:phage tail-like protein